MKKYKLISTVLVICVMFSVFTGFTPNTVGQSSLTPESLSNNSVTKEQLSVDESTFSATHSNILNYVNEEEFKSKEFISRVTEEENLSTYVFQSANGTKTVYFFDENIKYIDNDGKIVEKDVSLIQNENGYGVLKNEIELNIPMNPYEGIIIGYSNYNIKNPYLVPNFSSCRDERQFNYLS